MRYDELCSYYSGLGYEIHGRSRGSGGECHLVVSKRGNWDYGDKECRNFIGVKLDNSDAEDVCFRFSISGSALASRKVTDIIGDPEQFLLNAGLLRFRCFLQEDDTPGRREDFMLDSRSPETDFVMNDTENLSVEVNRIKKEILELLWKNKYNGSGPILKQDIEAKACALQSTLDAALNSLGEQNFIKNTDNSLRFQITSTGEQELERLRLHPGTELNRKNGSATDHDELYDVFICHASEDKEDFVRQLAEAIRSAGLKVWYDEFSLGLGDSIRERIDRGLAASRYGVVVLSHHFFQKRWPQQELNALFAKMGANERSILPIWHRLSARDVQGYSPMIADILAVDSSEGIDAVVKQIAKVISISPPTWINKLKIYESPLFAKNSEIELAKLTLIAGGNSTGKTALCEWFAGFSAPRYLERWTEYQREGLHVEIEYSNPENHIVAVSIPLNQEPVYTLDEKPSSLATLPLKTIFPGTITFEDYENQDDIELLSDAMNIHRYELLNLCEDKSVHESGYIKEICFEKDDERCYLLANLQSVTVDQPIHLRLLSDSERYQLMIELGILAAKKFAELSPTLLILDSGFWKLDTKWQKHYAELVASPTIKFQTIATMYPDRVNSGDSIWTEWSKVQLTGEHPNVEIQAV